MFPTRVAPLQRITTSRSCLQNAIRGSTFQRRAYTINRLEAGQLVASNPLAKRLKATKVWVTNRTAGKKGAEALKNEPPPVSGDKTRVNIVSERLCDDILDRLGKSLQKHQGCDLIDIYPGAGLWSSKLNEFLQPRSHIMMEPDAELYTPFLKPLLDKEGTALIPKSGIIWENLNSALSPNHLPHQQAYSRRDENSNKRNDTLLVSCNLAFHPRRRFVAFESIAMLLLHQFMDAIKNSSLFWKYGQVRMLIWVRREDKTNLLPRLIQKRRRTALDGELLCDSIHEVVGWNGREYSQFTRDTTTDRASALAVWKRMKKAKVETPEGRETDALKQAMQDSKLKKREAPLPGTTPPALERLYLDVLTSLQESGPRIGTDSHQNMTRLKWRLTSEEKGNEMKHRFQLKFDEISALKASGMASDTQITAMENELSEKIGRLPVASLSDFTSIRDNLHLYRQGGGEPVLHWDKRPYEPLLGHVEEFYPNADCSLLDINPRPVHHLVRDIGPGSSRAGESFELIQKALWSIPKEPIDKALDSVWPGAADWIVPRCPSFQDPARGGININVKAMELTVRTMNIEQWEDLLEQWYEWPFRPEFQDLLSRSQNVSDEEEGGPTSKSMDSM